MIIALFNPGARIPLSVIKNGIVIFHYITQLKIYEFGLAHRCLLTL
jgi:hypothetical protein